MISVIDNLLNGDSCFLYDTDYCVFVEVNRATGNAIRKVQRGEPMQSAELDQLDYVGPHLVNARLRRHPVLAESGCWSSGYWSDSGVLEFVLDRCEHAEGGVASAAVVEHLEVLEQGVGRLEAGAPSSAVEQFGLHASPERFDHGVVVAVADRAHRR